MIYFKLIIQNKTCEHASLALVVCRVLVLGGLTEHNSVTLGPPLRGVREYRGMQKSLFIGCWPALAHGARGDHVQQILSLELLGSLPLDLHHLGGG